MDTRPLWARIFGSRKVWIALAAVAGVVVTVAGADPAKWTPVITSIVTLAGVVIAAIGYEDGQAKSSDGATTVVTRVDNKPPANPDGSCPNAWLLLLVLPAALLAGGCQAFESPSAQYVAADRSTYTAIAPEYATYVAGDPNLTAEAKARRGRTIATWRLRITKAEEAGTTVDAATPPPIGPPPSLYQPLPPASKAEVRTMNDEGLSAPVVPPAAYVAAPKDEGEPQTIEMRPVEVPLRLR